MESKRKILVRYRRGDGIRAISRELNISRNTLRDIIRSQGNIRTRSGLIWQSLQSFKLPVRE